MGVYATCTASLRHRVDHHTLFAGWLSTVTITTLVAFTESILALTFPSLQPLRLFSFYPCALIVVHTMVSLIDWLFEEWIHLLLVGILFIIPHLQFLLLRRLLILISTDSLITRLNFSSSRITVQFQFILTKAFCDYTNGFYPFFSNQERMSGRKLSRNSSEIDINTQMIWFILKNFLLPKRREAEVNVEGHFLVRQIYEDDVTYNIVGAAERVLSKFSRIEMLFTWFIPWNPLC